MPFFLLPIPVAFPFAYNSWLCASSQAVFRCGCVTKLCHCWPTGPECHKRSAENTRRCRTVLLPRKPYERLEKNGRSQKGRSAREFWPVLLCTVHVAYCCLSCSFTVQWLTISFFLLRVMRKLFNWTLIMPMRTWIWGLFFIYKWVNYLYSSGECNQEYWVYDGLFVSKEVPLP